MELSNSRHFRPWLAVAAMCLMASAIRAASVAIPHTFSSGAPAKASDVNDNFTAVATAINAAASSNTALSNAVQSLQTAQVAGFVFRGAWSAAFIYGVNDVVSRN